MLELASNTVKVLGIFGRLSTEREAYFDELERQFSKKPEGDEYKIFRHLTLTFIPDATVADIHDQLKLLKELRQFLPLKIKVKDAFVKEEESLEGAEHIAIEFQPTETDSVTDFVRAHCDKYAVKTWYIKVVWFVPREKQAAVFAQLRKLEELEFTDFYLVANKQNEDNMLFTSRQFN